MKKKTKKLYKVLTFFMWFVISASVYMTIDSLRFLNSTVPILFKSPLMLFGMCIAMIPDICVLLMAIAYAYKKTSEAWERN